jgi:hypothetical protein
VLEKRLEATRVESERSIGEARTLRRENESLQKQLAECQAESSKEKSGRMVMETLIGTLRQNQEDLAAQLRSVMDERLLVEDAVKCAEESTTISVREVKHKSHQVQELHSEVSKMGLRCRQLEQSLQQMGSENDQQRVLVEEMRLEIEDAKSIAASSEERVSFHMGSANEYLKQAEAARAEAAAGDERCAVTQSSLDKLELQLMAALASFDEERVSKQEVFDLNICEDYPYDFDCSVVSFPLFKSKSVGFLLSKANQRF